jgi:hypothetical protein
MITPMVVIKGIKDAPPNVEATPGVNSAETAIAIDGVTVGMVGNGIPPNIHSIGITIKGIEIAGAMNGVKDAAIEAGI